MGLSLGEPQAGLRLTGSDWPAIGLLLLVAAAVRATFLHFQEIPTFDPWRHLELVRSLRSGAGFTLFEGQPYLWYSPIWYRLVALTPPSLGMEVLAAIFSTLAVPPVYLLLRRGAGPSLPAVGGGVLMAASGPLVAFTCHYGPEALALCLTLWAVVVALFFRAAVASFVAGVVFGIALVLRMNFAFNIFLFLPLVRGPRRGLAAIAGTALPLAVTWWRNHAIIRDHDWLFTWDGLATRTADFNLLSTLVVQMHPDVQEGLRRLHEIIVPRPEWTGSPGTVLFMLCGVLAVVFSRRADLILTVALTMGYFGVLDASNSSNFFRLYLVLFPAFFLALATSAATLRERLPGITGRAAAWIVVCLPLLGGAQMLVPAPMAPLEMVTPPPQLLTEPAYMVNSTYYHPESLIHRFPEKKFIGLPLNPDHFDEFSRNFPTYRHILWHDFSVQDEIAIHLQQRGYRIIAQQSNKHGRNYTVLEAPNP